ncbi:CvpA family protein [Chitinimonas lacunae]|uniref:CvpA family protein n=1 Tax=Chitinimonas lacunae TaxID=1963018 RepID=A0ABV8MNI9_9NEIS
MTGFDYAVLIVIGLSILLAVLRGGVSEILSLVAWVLAFFLAQRYASEAAQWLPPEVPTAELRLLAGFIAIFLGVWFVSAIVRITVYQFIKAVGLTPLDRAIGALFGLARGLVIVVAAVVVAGLTSLPRQPVWRNAMFSPPFEALALTLRPALPAALGQHIRYD